MLEQVIFVPKPQITLRDKNFNSVMQTIEQQLTQVGFQNIFGPFPVTVFASLNLKTSISRGTLKQTIDHLRQTSNLSKFFSTVYFFSNPQPI